MKNIIMRGLAGLVLVAVIAAVGLYVVVYPRHYKADEFVALKLIAEAANQLRQSESRGSLPQEKWPYVIIDLYPKDVRVYPSGVLIPLRGFFSYESGLYIPTEEVSKKIEARKMPIYQRLGKGVYSYKIEG